MRVLAVDDEKEALFELLKVVRQVLPRAEARGFLLSSEALIAAQSWQPDIALLDIRMPEMDGLALARALQRRYPRLNIIFTTAYQDYAKEALDLHASGYLLKPVTQEQFREELRFLRFPLPRGPEPQEERVQVRTFGSFEVFYRGKPLRFQYRKTRELFAYLVDRSGAMCSNGEIIAALWEDEDPEQKSHYLYRLREDLRRALESCGAAEALDHRRGEMAIVPDRLDCDFYAWLKGEPLPSLPGGNAFQGEYMSQYSWAEFTAGWIAQQAELRREEYCALPP